LFAFLPTEYDDVAKIATGKIQFTPTLDQVGNYSLNISVIDSHGMMDSEIVEFEVVLNNTAPNITSHFPEDLSISLTENALVIFNISKDDYEKQTLAVKWYLDQVIVLQTSDDAPYIPNEYSYLASVGTHNLTVFVIDPYNFTDEREWTISVSASGSPTGPGGGGGGGGSPLIMKRKCEPDWNCSKWSPCQLPGVQYRSCVDLNDCPGTWEKPEERRNCTFILSPSCFDGIKNQGELEIDCGGPCNPCSNCYDGIQNQGEEGVDCGGPCPRQCGALYALYPLCGDGVCQGTDVLFCWQDCKQTYYIIVIAAILLAIYLLYGSKKLMRSIKKAIRQSKLKLMMKEKKAPALVVIAELERIEKAASEKNINVLFKTYSKLIKEFFSVFYLIKYEFTFEELRAELNRKGVDKDLIKKIGNVFDVVERVEYGKYAISYEAFINAIGLSKLVIAEIVQTKEMEKEDNFLDKIVRKIRGEKKLKINEAFVLLKTKIKEGNKVEATKYYKRVKELYTKLSQKEKRTYYKDLIKVYGQIKKIKG
jgi:hypothetical protein